MALAASATRERRLDRGATARVARSRTALTGPPASCRATGSGARGRCPPARARWSATAWSWPCGSASWSCVGRSQERNAAGASVTATTASHPANPIPASTGAATQPSDPIHAANVGAVGERIGEGRGAGEHVEHEVQAARRHGRGPGAAARAGLRMDAQHVAEEARERQVHDPERDRAPCGRRRKRPGTRGDLHGPDPARDRA